MGLKKYESFYQDKINEELGWKDAVLGVLSLLAMGNIAKAGDKLADNQKLKTEVTNVLNNKDEMKTMIDSLAKQGLKDPEARIKANAEKLLGDIDNDGKKKDGLTTVVQKDKGKSFASVKSHLQAGYAITGVELKTLRDTIIQKAPKATVYYDTVKITFNPDQFFANGQFTINNGVRDTIVQTLEMMHQSHCIATRVVIESSTDKEAIGPVDAKLLKANGYEATNQGLSKARNNGVKGIMTSVFKDHGSVPEIVQSIKFEQGKGTVGATTEQDPSARYVTAIIYGVCVDSAKTAPPPATIVEHIVASFEFAKTCKVSYPEVHKTPGIKISVGKTPILGGDVISCPALGGK